MARYRDGLPQLGDGLYLTDGGIETSMIALEGFELDDFAVFPLLSLPEGDAALRRYFSAYAEIARRHGTGLILETATWRASAGWGDALGVDAEEVAAANRRAVNMLQEVRAAYETQTTAVVISGCVGPRYDGFDPEVAMSAAEAEAYHGTQIDTLAATAVDMVGALTLTSVDEAVGIAVAARRAALPVAISFTVETDGRLASGPSLDTAIEAVDAATAAYPAYYMVNCAHPSHFGPSLLAGGPGVERVRGLRANASRLSHADLDALPEPDAGDPAELARQYVALRRRLRHLTIFGGCCGTDHRHLERIGAALAPLFGPSA